MSDSDASSPDPMLPPDRIPPLQFSLAWLLMAVTLVAVLLGLSQTTAGFSIVASMLSALVEGVLPAALVICALFGRGELRTFSIGALVPWLVTRPYPQLAVGIGRISDWWSVIVVWGFTLVTAAASGAVAVVAYRWIQRHDYGP
jgi:hypothetical protein